MYNTYCPNTCTASFNRCQFGSGIFDMTIWNWRGMRRRWKGERKDERMGYSIIKWRWSKDGDKNPLKGEWNIVGKKLSNRTEIVLFTSKLDLDLRKKLVKYYICSMALYGTETWTLRAADQTYLERFEMWCWRIIIIMWRFSYSDWKQCRPLQRSES